MGLRQIRTTFFILLFSVASYAADLPIVSVDVKDVATTQGEVGGTAVETMMKFWAKEAKGSPSAFLNYLRDKVLSKPFPGVMGPDLWTESGEPKRTYILDGHHRASALSRIFYQDYETLPSELKQVMSKDMQLGLRENPAFRFKVAVEKDFSSVQELVMDFVHTKRGQLPTSVKRDPFFMRALMEAEEGDVTHLKLLIHGYRHMAPSISGLKDSPIRSAVGVALYTSGIITDDMINYVEFEIAEQIESRLVPRGIKLTAENSSTAAVVEKVQEILFEDSVIVQFMKDASRPGKHDEVEKIVENARAKYVAAHSVPHLKPCPEAYAALNRAR